MPRHHLARLLLAASLTLAACSHAPPPDHVQAVATAAPPEPRHEERGHAPHPGWVWIPGYWNWVNDHYIWVPGFWGVPPSGFSTWDAAHWIHNEQGWVLVRGKWK